jgi:hypothetical protein
MPVDPVVTRRFIESLSTHMEDHLATWKSSLVDARREIEKLLGGLSEKIPAHAKPLFPEELMALILEDVMPPPAAPEKIIERVSVPTPAAPSAPDWALVRGSFAAIESARTQVDILTRFLGQANAHASRVALLVLRNDRLTGWKAIGYDTTGGHDEGVKAIDIAAGDDPFVAEALRTQRSMLAEPPDENSVLRKMLGGRSSARLLLVPMIIRDRLAGLVCADELHGEEGRLNEAAIEVLTFVTGLAVDLLAARKKIPSPSLTPTGEPIARFRPAGTEPGATARALPRVVLELESGPLATRGDGSSSPSAAGKPPAGEASDSVGPSTKPAPTEGSGDSAKKRVTDASQALKALESSGPTKRPEPPRSAMQLPGSGAPSAPPIDPGLTSAVPAVPPPLSPSRPASTAPPLTQFSFGDFAMPIDALGSPPPRPAPTAPPGAPGAPAPVVDTEKPKPEAVPAAPAAAEAPAAAVRPISGFIPRARAGSVPESPQRALEDAKRLARLLISEIKLYNERKVDEGRGSNDLYGRLKDDIERSRQVYDERTPEFIRKSTTFFHDELVRILADGRPEALGPIG